MRKDIWHNMFYNSACYPIQGMPWSEPMNKKSSGTLPFVNKNCSLTRALVRNIHFDIDILMLTFYGAIMFNHINIFQFLNRIHFITGHFCFHVNRSHTFPSRLIFSLSGLSFDFLFMTQLFISNNWKGILLLPFSFENVVVGI